jgi:DNA-binding response OmpR family regulator
MPCGDAMPGPTAQFDGPSPKCILIVDDDDSVRGSILRTLGARGFTLCPAASAEAGLAVLANPTNRFDLIICDIMLPGISGVTFVEQIRAAGHRCPVLLITGFAGTHLSPSVFQLEGVRILHKPFRPQEMREQVRAMLDASAG